MKPYGTALVGTLAAMMAWTAPLGAQGYRVRVDTRLQSMAFRGLTLDSVATADVVTGAGGGLESPDGFAVRCRPGPPFCTFYRPGPTQRGSPLVTTVDASAWALGIPGLKVRAKVRLSTDLGEQNVWPGTSPAVQLLEGYAEYASRFVSGQAGRTHVITRLGFTGFDGAKVELRPLGRPLSVFAYGGWGLARGASLPVTSPELNPLGDFQPRDRQLVAGAGVGWSIRRFAGRAVYQREVDPAADAFVSERAAFAGSFTPLRGITLSGGADYDIAAGLWGTADLSLAYTTPSGAVHGAVGGRRYRPYFDLWTIWGAFSPVPYSAAFGSAAVTPVAGLELRGRAEVYRFDAAEAATPLARVEDDGWRWSIAATVSRLRQWTFDAAYHAETGPGAASLGFEGGVAFRPDPAFAASAHVSRLQRPLEFRFNESKIWSYGVRLDYAPTPAVRFGAEIRRYDETRDRDDAGRLEWNQLRVNVGATFVFGSSITSGGLHPAILRIPDVGRSR